MRLFTLLALLTLSSLFAQTRRNFNELPEVWPDTTAMKTDPLKFISITEKQFTDIKHKPVRKKDQQTVTAAKQNDTVLVVTTKNAYYELPAEGAYEESWGYIEYLPEVHSHLLTSCGDGACAAYLLDNETDKKMYVPSFYDAGLIDLLVSPSGTYMLIYSSYDGPDYVDYYAYRSAFMIYKICKGKGPEGLSVYRDFGSKDWSIQEIVWADDTTLALKVYTENNTGNSQDPTYYYYKTVIK